MDPRLAQLAARQSGLITVTQALEVGITRRQLSRRLGAGELVEHQPGVLAAATTPLDSVTAARAALLACGPLAVLSHLSAAHVWGYRERPPERPWITLPFRHALPRVEDVEVVRSRHLEGVRRQRSGFPVTAPARTLVDSARALDEAAVEAIMATAFQRGHASPEEVRGVLLRAHHTGGTAIVRRLLEHFDPRWESALSAHLGRELAAAGLDLIPSYEVRDASGEVRAVLDFADPVSRTGFEADGWAFHGSQAQQLADRRRDRWLVGEGWCVLRYPGQEVMRQGPLIAREAARILARRRAA